VFHCASQTYICINMQVTQKLYLSLYANLTVKLRYAASVVYLHVQTVVTNERKKSLAGLLHQTHCCCICCHYYIHYHDICRCVSVWSVVVSWCQTEPSSLLLLLLPECATSVRILFARNNNSCATMRKQCLSALRCCYYCCSRYCCC
jgi:hypothetical protein